MLTRKQLWRRVRGRRLVEATADAPKLRRPAPTLRHHNSLLHGRPVNPVDALAIGDSPRNTFGAMPTPSEDNEGDDGNTLSPSPSARGSTPGKPRVSFHNQVQVVLVPSRRDLRPLYSQLWWDTEDFLNFRREYIFSLQLAARATQDKQQPPPSHAANPQGTPSKKCTDSLPSKSPPPPPPQPPQLSSTKLATPLPSTNAEAAAAAKMTIVETGGGRKCQPEVDDGDDGGVTAAGVNLASTTISSNPPAAVAAVVVSPTFSMSTLGDPKQNKTAVDDERRKNGIVATGALSRPPPAVILEHWTASAGAAAAKAAAAEEEADGYRTQSMSSVSNNNFDESRELDTDEHDIDSESGYEPDQEGEGRALVAKGKQEPPRLPSSVGCVSGPVE